MTYEVWTAKAVEERVVEAAETLMLTPKVGGGGSYWPEVIRSTEESYGYSEASFRRRPSAGALSRMMETWEWINTHPDEKERKLLYSWAWVKAKRGRFLNDFAAREGVKSRTLRWAISRICQRIANRLNNRFEVWESQPVDDVAEIAAETASQTVSSETCALHWRGDDAKPTHDGSREGIAAFTKHLKRVNRARRREQEERKAQSAEAERKRGGRAA